MAEGARLLIECGVCSPTEGSNPSVTVPLAPLAQLDRASGYGPEGREFESLRVRHLSPTDRVGGAFLVTESHRVRGRPQ